MKTEDLKALGLTDEQIKFIFAENGKDIQKLQDEVKALSSERDKFKTQAETAETALKGFEGKDPDKLAEELEKWKAQAEADKKDFEKKLYDRDYNDALNSAMGAYRFTSEAAKKAVMSDIKAAGLTLKEGKILGLGDLIEQIRQSDGSAFVNEEQEQLEQGRARFTEGMSGGSKEGSSITRADIEKIKDRTERQKAIAEHMDLFK